MTYNKPLFPFYDDENDYNTNAPSFYDYLAKQQKLIKKLATRIWEYDERLDKRLEDLENVLQDYLTQWDDRIENLDKEVEHIFIEWLEDGTLEEIINHEVLGNKLDTEKFNQAVKYVTYDMFKEGSLNDNETILKAHTYANENKLPVINLTGEYYLDEPINIPIQTPTNFGNSIFHIDESKSKNGVGNFLVKSSKPVENITLDETEKSNLINQLNKGNHLIKNFPQFKNKLVRVLNNNINQYQRYLNGEPSNLWKLEDHFYVGDGGRIDGLIEYDFDDYTDLELYEGEQSYLIIEGGTFLLNGQGNRNAAGSYVQNGFYIERSRTVFKNQFVGMEETDTIGLDLNYSSGFYYYRNLYDVKFENIKGLPRISYQSTGTYGFYGRGVVKITYDKVDATANDSYWGLNSHNKIKDLIIKNSRISRIDTHYDVQNVSIINSEIDHLALNGGGKLEITDSTINNNTIVDFRLDYGGSWDGDIKIDNVILVPQTESVLRLVAFRSGGYDHLGEVVWGRTISIDNLQIDYKNIKTDVDTVIFYIDAQGNYLNGGEKTKAFNRLNVKNIYQTNKVFKKGITLGHLAYPQNLIMDNENSFEVIPVSETKSELKLTHNAEMIIEDVEFSNVTNNFSSSISSNQAFNGYDNYSMIPKITFRNCGELNLLTNGLKAEINLINSGLRFVRSHVSTTSNLSGLKLNLFDSWLRLSGVVTQVPIDTNLYNVLTKPNDTLSHSFSNGFFQVSPTNRRAVNFINNMSNVTLSNELVNHLIGQVGNDVAYELGLALSRLNKFKELSGIENGTSTQRPVLNDFRNSIGQTYYDRILGKLILFNGTDWVNLDGTSL